MVKPINFGISSWSYPWAIGPKEGPQPPQKMTAKELIERAHQHGVSLVQIADNLPLEELSRDELIEVKELADTYSIQLEVGTKGLEKEHLLNFISIAKLFNSPILRTLPAIFGKRVPVDEVEDCLRAVIPDLQDSGIVLVLENQEAYTVAEYASLMQKINHPNIRICLDLANALGAMEGPDYVMEKLVPYTGNYHFKDVMVIRSKTLMGFTVEGCPAGKGKIPLRATLDLLKQNSLFPTVIIELWPPLQESMAKTLKLEEQFVKESVEFMRTVNW